MFKDSSKNFGSLFEEPSKPLWSKNRPEIKNVNFQGQVQYCKSGSSSTKKCTIYISQDYLIQIENNNYKRHIDLNNIILERTQKNLTIRLTRNKKSIEITPSELDFANCFHLIKQYAIQRSFTEDYKLLKIQGEGNFAKVYKALGKDNCTYAVKAFDKKNFKNVQLERDALKLEISIMRKIHFPSIIRLYEVYETDQHIWLVTDYLEGGELFDYLKKQPQGFNELQVAILMARLLQALDYLHQQNIIHRDIKPENIIIKNPLCPTDICIADFGLADYYKPDGKYLFKRCGTPGYVAPEILQEKNYDCKVDIFSAGILMFIMLSGQSPFQAKSKNDLVMKNYNCDINFNINNLQMKISAEASQLLQQLLQKDPLYRPSANQALSHTWFVKSFAQLNQINQIQLNQINQLNQLNQMNQMNQMMNMNMNGIFLQPNLIPQYQPYPDLYQRSPIMNQMLNLSISSLSLSNNSSNVTPQRSKSNTQQGVRTQSHSYGTDKEYQQMLQNEKLISLGQIEEEEYVMDYDVQEEQPHIHQIKNYSINAQKKNKQQKSIQQQSEHIIIE